MKPETRYAKTADGVRVAYQVFGNGRRDILYLPGLIGHVEIHWEEPTYAAFLSGLASFARVIAVDRRGQGLSDRLSPDDLPPPEVLVEDLAAVLDEVRSLDTVLVGHDEGAQIGILFAASQPERLRGLVLYGSSPAGVKTPRAPWGSTESEIESWMEWVVARWGTSDTAIPDVQETMPSMVGDEAFTRWVAKVYRYGVSPNAFLALTRLGMQLDVTDVLPTVRVPTLVVHRTADRLVPVEAGRFMASCIPEARFVELPGMDHFPNGPDHEPLVDAIREFVEGPRPSPSHTRRLATVLFTDIVGSTAKAAEIGDRGWSDLVEKHYATVRGILARFHGAEVDTAGDGFLATFEGPARAVHCAKEIVDAVRMHGVEVRAGVHTGEVEMIDAKVGGIAVNIGARVCALAEASQVLVSSTVRDLVAGSGLVFEDWGDHELKGVPGEWRLYAVAWG